MHIQGARGCTHSPEPLAPPHGLRTHSTCPRALPPLTLMVLEPQPGSDAWVLVPAPPGLPSPFWATEHNGCNDLKRDLRDLLLAHYTDMEAEAQKGKELSW